MKLNRRELRRLIESVINEESAMDAAKDKAEKSAVDKRAAPAQKAEDKLKKRLADVRKTLNEKLTTAAQQTAEWFKNTVLPAVEEGEKLDIVADKSYVIYVDNALIYTIPKGTKIESLDSQIQVKKSPLNDVRYIADMKDELQYAHMATKKAKGPGEMELSDVLPFLQDDVKADKIDMEDQTGFVNAMMSAPGHMLNLGMEALGMGDNDIASLYEKFEKMVIDLDLRVEIESAREVFSESKRLYVDQEPLSRGSLYRKRYYGRY